MVDKKKVRIGDNNFANGASRQNGLMGRDSIYVDTDDDITSVIEKVKDSKSAVIALVPPARSGVLQSVVNLKLLQNASKKAHKQLSLVTSDKALVSLASGLKIPVSKNLAAQAEIPVLRNDFVKGDDDEIDGKDLGVGELAALGNDDVPTASEAKENAAVDAIETDDEIRGDEGDGKPDDDKPKNVRQVPVRPVRNKKIPNFNKFRKWLLIGGGIIIALALFMVWATIWAPRGTITVAATTTSTPVSASLSLTPNDATDINSLSIQPIAKTITKTETVNFTATGTQLVGGARATGTVTISTSSASAAGTIGNSLAAGTQLTLGSNTYVTTATANFSSQGSNWTATDVPIVASGLGASYNTSNGGGALVSYLNTTVSGSASGGEDQTKQSIVQQSDLDTAVNKIKSQDNTSQIKSQLKSQFGSGATVIDSSFAANYATATSSPSVGSAVSNDSTATASVSVSYVMFAISNSDLKAFLDSQLQSSLANSGKTGQKIYDDGFSKVQLTNFKSAGHGNYSVAVTATGQIGPNIDADHIKSLALGRKSGQISSVLQSEYSNISKVDVNFSPFWISSISNKNQLTVNFAVSNRDD